MSVPDWPNTYGYNMFLFPVSKWVGGIFYEHTHRLVASGVGLLTTILAVWLWFREPTPGLKWLGVAAFVGVVVQGVLGGLRVTLFRDELGIFHATLAQLFLVLVSSIALISTRWWRERPSFPPSAAPARRLFLLGSILVLLQLMLGATMRHQHAGLAIPDFPLAYGRLWPRMDAESISFYNQQRVEVNASMPLTKLHLVVHMSHRLMALAILGVVAASTRAACKHLGSDATLSRLAMAWLALIGAQAILGAMTVLTGKSADVATAHVAVGALSLVLGSLLYLISRDRSVSLAGQGMGEPSASEPFTESTFAA